MAICAQTVIPLTWCNNFRSSSSSIAAHLAGFKEFGKLTRQVTTRYGSFDDSPHELPTFVNEFWTSKQRGSSRLHQISYRACFKAELPRFFIERLTAPGQTVYDPLMGRGTTLVEAALLGRVPFGCDINPLSKLLVAPRLNPPTLDEVATRLAEIDYAQCDSFPEELLVFYHQNTLKEIVSLRQYLATRRAEGAFDSVDAWIEMVALNRLTGHSNGFFSVYTLPPNQAVSVQSQCKINKDRNQAPPRRYVPSLILRKTRILLKDCEPAIRGQLRELFARSLLLTKPASATPEIPDASVDLVVTSPPFLDVVNYAGDNWLRCWFVGFDAQTVPITTAQKLEDWQTSMTAVLRELRRVLKPGGHIAFEVGEVRGGKIRLEEAILPCGLASDLSPMFVMINDQKFTKTSNCWGVDNGDKGTNTNRIVLFRK